MDFIFFFGIIAFILLVSNNRAVLQVCFFAIAVFFSMRNDLVPDAAAYREMYEDLPYSWSAHIEAGYLSFKEFFKFLGFSFQGFLFILVLAELECWYYASMRLFKKFNISHLFLLCFAYYGIYFYGIVLRASISLTIIYVGYAFLLTTNKKPVLKWAIFTGFVFLSFLFHRSSIIYVLVPLFTLRFGYRWEMVGLIAGVILFFTTSISALNQFIESVIGSVDDLDRFQGYVNTSAEQSISLGWLTTLLITILAIIAKRPGSRLQDDSKFNFFSEMYLAGFLVTSLTIHIPAGARLGMMFIFFEFVVVYYLINKWKVRNPYMRFCWLLAYIGLKFGYLIHKVPLLLNYSFS